MPARRLWPAAKLAAKLVVAVVIVAAVGWHFARLLANDAFTLRPLAARWPYLLPAGLLYLAAHTVWGTFWWLLLRFEGAVVPWPVAVRAYFVSQFGKYVPGKVAVLGLRVGLLHGRRGATWDVVLVTGIYETLTSMAAGAILAAVLLPYTGVAGEFAPNQGFILLAVAAVPLAAAVVNKLAAGLVRRKRGPDARPLPSPPVWLLAAGLLHDAAGWCLLGVSLRLTVLAVVPDPAPWDAGAFAADLAAVAASYVAGFLALPAPGGLGAREFVLQEVLAVRAGGPAAVLVALVLRLVWTGFEVVLAGGLYLSGWRAVGRVESSRPDGPRASGLEDSTRPTHAPRPDRG